MCMSIGFACVPEYHAQAWCSGGQRRNQILWNLFLLRTQVQLPHLPGILKLTLSSVTGNHTLSFAIPVASCTQVVHINSFRHIHIKTVNVNLKNLSRKVFQGYGDSCLKGFNLCTDSTDLRIQSGVSSQVSSTVYFENIGLHLTRHNLIINEKYKYCSKSYLLMDVQVEIMPKIIFPKTYTYNGNIFCISRHFIYPGTRNIN